MQKILKMSRVLWAPLNVTVATFVSMEVSTEGQVPKIKVLGSWIHWF